MQDSLEDYIRICSNTKQPQPKDNNAFKETCERKKTCEDYAFKIVEFMMEGKLQPQIFLKSICFINQEHYQDVVEERAITKLCGYPLCGKKLPPMPNKQYFILNKQNKVFDITERKNFCSNYCYQASCHIKEQIDTSPLWLRKPEDFPEFKLMTDMSQASPGIEISTTVKPDDTPDARFTSVASFTEFCLDEAEELENNPENEDHENDMEQFGSIEVIESSSTDKPKSILKKSGGSKKKVQISKKYDEVAKNEINSILSDNRPARKSVKFNALQEDSRIEESNITEPTNTVKQVKDSKESVKIVAEASECDKNEVVQIASSAPGKQAKKNKELKMEINLKSMEELPKCTAKIIEKIQSAEKVDRNVDELVQKVKRMEISRRKKTDEDEKMRRVLEKLQNKKVEAKRPIIIDTIGNPELKLEELKAEEGVKKAGTKAVAANKIKKVFLSWLTLETLGFLHGEDKVKEALSEEVLGDYFDKLKVAESETERQIRYMNICKRLKLREMAEEKFEEAALNKQYKPPPDFTQLKVESKDMNLKVRAFYTGNLYEKDDPNFKSAKTERPDEIPMVLPIVETGHQNTLRKKIFINSATKYVQTHVTELSLPETVTAEVQELAKTFKLEADNITFKPATWNVIGLVLIYVLSVKDSVLRDKLNTDDAVSYKGTTLTNCSTVLDEVLDVVTNLNLFVEKHVTLEE